MQLMNLLGNIIYSKYAAIDSSPTKPYMTSLTSLEYLWKRGNYKKLRRGLASW